LDVKISSGDEVLEAITAADKVAGILDIKKGSPVFKRTRITNDQYKRPIEYSICYYPGDKYKYSIKL
jgi:GntR family transcriptional regulator